MGEGEIDANFLSLVLCLHSLKIKLNKTKYFLGRFPVKILKTLFFSYHTDGNEGRAPILRNEHETPFLLSTARN